MSATSSSWEALDSRLFDCDRELEPGARIFLRTSYCGACDRHEFPAREGCVACGGPVAARRITPTGSISGFTSVHHRPPGGLVDVPYAVAVVDFPESISILGLVENVRESNDLAFGDEVEVVASQVGEKIGFAYRVLSAGK